MSSPSPGAEFPGPAPLDPHTVPLPLLLEGPGFVVVAKPSGLAVHRGLARDPTYVLQRLRDALGTRVHLVHRLDRATSGALLVALDPDTARTLMAQFEARTVTKTYHCLVRGRTPDDGVIDSPMARDGGEEVPAVTRYRTLARARRASWLEVTPETGRRRQIRRHLRRIDHPLIGDVNLGDGRVNREFRQRCGLWRLALHASTLAFDHPVTGQRVTVSAPLPSDLAEPLRRLQLPV